MEGAAAGDWICSDASCGNVNFARRVTCNRCGRRRVPTSSGTEIGKSAADKSRGLFSADDWQCSKCCNVNWARRLTCNVCNAPKFGEVEARTGYGGGYNERGVIEYRQRHDSDDEYDEFGRVKKRKGKDPQQKVSTNRRHLGSISDSSLSPPLHTSRTDRLPPDSAYRENPNTYKSPNKRESCVSPRKKRQISPTSVERVTDNTTVTDKRSQSHNSSAEKNNFQTKGINIRDTAQWKHFYREFADQRFVNHPRDCIMENRVTSTNDVKYRFKGKTIDENFEVTYTLEERIKVAAWAITFQNCKHSAEKFQRTFDKPAPDFNTIFSWRQRLLSTGCLVDVHVNTETSGKETSDCHIRRRKRRRYYKIASKNLSPTSEDDYNDVRLGIKKNKINKTIPQNYNSDGTGENLEFKNCRNKSEEDTNSENKRHSLNDNNTNGSVCRSSTSGAKHSVLEDSKRSDCFLTDNARSETPEITIARVELAQLKSPNRVTSPETRFNEDDYFDDVKNSNKSGGISPFLIPDTPKQLKEKSQKPVEYTSKGLLEDIVSESEKYSSDGGEFNSNFYNKYHNKSTRKLCNPTVNYPNKTLGKNIDCSENILEFNSTAGNCTKRNDVDSVLPRFGNKRRSSSHDGTTVISTETDQNNGKNLSSAMRRIIESMSNQVEEKDSNNEYVPTKIDPAMAKRNHQLFSSIHDIWPDSNNSSGSGSMLKSNNINKNGHSKKTDEGYIPDDDTLYKEETTERKCDDPPKAPTIGSLTIKNVETDDADSIKKINSFLHLNFSGINSEDIALALKSIQTLSTLKKGEFETEKDEDEENCPDIQLNLNKSNIPFLDDMFYSGSPSREVKNNENNSDDKRDSSQDVILDDFAECAQTKKLSSTSLTGFKSFAIPKPIMLNRLRNLNQQSKNVTNLPTDNKIKTKGQKIKKKKVKSNDNGYSGEDKKNKQYEENDEDEDESGEEGDLSKYELWESEDESDKKSKNPVNKEIEVDPQVEKVVIEDVSTKKQENSKSSPIIETKRTSDRSGSVSSKRSSSTSSSSGSSSGRTPRNRYDDFILNSEHSRAGSRDSSSARSRSPVYNKFRNKDKRKSRSRDRGKDRNRDREKDRERKFRDNRDVNKSRDRDRDRHRHYSGTNRSYIRGRAR